MLPPAPDVVRPVVPPVDGVTGPSMPDGEGCAWRPQPSNRITQSSGRAWNGCARFMMSAFLCGVVQNMTPC